MSRGVAKRLMGITNGPGCAVTAVCAMRVCFLPAICSGFSCAGGFLFGAPGARLPYRGVALFGRFVFGFELKAEWTACRYGTRKIIGHPALSEDLRGHGCRTWQMRLRKVSNQAQGPADAV